MAFNQQGSIEGYGSDQNTNSTDHLAVIRELTRGTGEITVIKALQRFAWPIFEPLFRPLIHQLVKDELAARQEVLISLKENASVLKNLKLQFRNKIAQPVFTGMPLLGENQEPIKITLLDALSGQIVNTGAESAAKLEIMGLRVGDGDDTWTDKDVQERILSERNGRRILQGNTCLQLKEGVGFLHKISFTHNSKHTRNGLYRLVAVYADAALNNEVEVAWSETFVMKDRRCTYHEKHPCPALSDKVCHLQQISYKGARYKRLKNAGVYRVKDLLRLLYTDPKQLEDVILQLKAPSKFWDDIVKNAQASSGMFLYLDPRNEQKTGVVLDVKLQLKALIVEPCLYIAANQLSEQQKVQTQDVMKYASEHFDMLHPFDHEASLQEYLQLGPGFTSLPSAMMTGGPPTPSSQVTKASHSLDNQNHKPFVTTQSERGKEKVPFDGEMIPSVNDYKEHNSFHPPSLESPNGCNSGTAKEPGTSLQAGCSSLDTCEPMNISDINDPILNESWLVSLLNESWLVSLLNESPIECHSNPAIVSFCTAQTRWIKAYKLLRRNSVRERICLTQRNQPLKKQRCC